MKNRNQMKPKTSVMVEELALGYIHVLRKNFSSEENMNKHLLLAEVGICEGSEHASYEW